MSGVKERVAKFFFIGVSIVFDAPPITLLCKIYVLQLNKWMRQAGIGYMVYLHFKR